MTSDELRVRLAVLVGGWEMMCCSRTNGGDLGVRGGSWCWDEIEGKKHDGILVGALVVCVIGCALVDIFY